VVLGGYFLLRVGKAPSSQKLGQETKEEKPEVKEEDSVTDSQKPIVVEGSEYKFEPATLTVKQGEKVTILFRNKGSMSHDFRIDEFGVATSILRPGEEEEVSFVATETNTFSFYCSVGNHRALGMEGKLIVQ